MASDAVLEMERVEIANGRAMRRALQRWDTDLAGQQKEIRFQLVARGRHLQGELQRIERASADPCSDGPIGGPTVQGRGAEIDALLVRLEAINETRSMLVTILSGTS